MKVILRENVNNLGKIGDVVQVADGYGRNFLLPRKLALLANERNVRELEHHRRVTQVRLAHARVAALSIHERLDQLRLTVRKHVGEEGKLYGSVTTREITDMLADKGFELDRRDVTLPLPIKAAGEFQVNVKLHHDLEAAVFVIVEPIEQPAPPPEPAPEPEMPIEPPNPYEDYDD